MEYIITVVWTFLELLFVVLFFSAFLENRLSKKRFYIAFFGLYAIMVLYSLAIDNGTLKQMLSIAIMLAMSFYVFKGGVLIHIFLIIVSFVFIVALDTALLYSSSYLLGVSVSEFIWMKFNYTIVITVGKLLLVLIVWLLWKRRRENSFSGISGPPLLLLTIVFPTISVVMLVVMFFGLQRSGDLSYGVVIFSVVLVIANVATLYLICLNRM